MCVHICKNLFQILLTEVKMIQIYSGGYTIGEVKCRNTKAQRTEKGTNEIILSHSL